VPQVTLPIRPNLTMRAHGALLEAWRIAARRGAADVAPIDVALGLLQERRSVAAALLEMRGVDLDALERDLRSELPEPSGAGPSSAPPAWTPELERVVSLARAESQELGVEFYGVEQVLLALLRDELSVAARVMKRHGLSYDGARGALQQLYAARPDA
jgi:ATP-dependent Clp protease ATP-binding subunit ClpA